MLLMSVSFPFTSQLNDPASPNYEETGFAAPSGVIEVARNAT